MEHMKKWMMTLGVGLALSVHSFAAVAGFNGTYTYKLILRDDWGLALSGTGSESVSSNYKIEVYTSGGVKLNASVADASFDGGRTVGHNCTVSVPVGEDSGYAKIGEQLTLVVTEKYSGSEKFRSSKVLPPVGGMFGIADAPVGAFWSDSTDTDSGWDVWRLQIERSLADATAISLGGPDADYDGDGLSNLREYQFGTDPAGGALGLANTPECSVVETDGVYKVSFNYGWNHVYSVRVIEGTEAVGRAGQDLGLYESIESLTAGTAYGTYFYDLDYNTGILRKEAGIRSIRDRPCGGRMSFGVHSGWIGVVDGHAGISDRVRYGGGGAGGEGGCRGRAERSGARRTYGRRCGGRLQGEVHDGSPAAGRQMASRGRTDARGVDEPR